MDRSLRCRGAEDRPKRQPGQVATRFDSYDGYRLPGVLGRSDRSRRKDHVASQWPHAGVGGAASEASRDFFYRLACRGDGGRFAVEQPAPKTIGVAARFGAAGEVAIQRHAAVSRAVAAGRVLIAITYIEDLEGRIGKRLTAGTPRAGNDRTIGKVLAHDRDPHGTRRRCPSAVSLAATPGTHRRKSSGPGRNDEGPFLLLD